MELKFDVKLKIQRPIDDVFDAVYNPEKLSGYFTTGGASAPLDGGTTVQWGFDDNPGKPVVSFPVAVLESRLNELIVLEWEGAVAFNTRVEMHFEKNGEAETIVKISETGWRETQSDLDRSYMNCFGWGQMACCLKAFVEYNINLRKGAFGGLY